MLLNESGEGELLEWPYFRLTILGYYRMQNILTHLVPFLVREKPKVERALLLHAASAEIGRIKRKV